MHNAPRSSITLAMSCLRLSFLFALISTFLYPAFGTFESDTRKESFFALTSVGEIQCGIMCVQNGRCAAINYNRNQVVCELVETFAVLVSETAGWKHTSDFAFVANQVDLCGSVTITKSFVCVPLSSQTTALVKNACIAVVPTPSHAVASTDQIHVGVVVTFTCEGGFVGVGQGTSTCLADGQWSTPDYQCSETQWPDGTYTLLQPSNGCPAGFSTGHRVWYPEQTGYSTFSTDNNLQGYANRTQIDWHFCTKSSGTSEAWPAGDYCIMRKGGVCPTGFSSGLITIDEDDSAPSGRSQGSGVLPDGEYNTNSDVFFCCKNDGSVAVEANFPVSTPFILFRYTMASCQLISGMTAAPGYTFFDTEPNGNIDKFEGSVAYKGGPPTWYIYHCYYY